jgi:hypothetical protein
LSIKKKQKVAKEAKSSKRSKKKQKNSLSYFLNLLYKIESFYKIPRLFWNFHFWTFFLSIFEKRKKVLEKKIIKKMGKNCYHKNSYGIKQ